MGNLLPVSISKGAERRRYPRYGFEASAECLEVVETESGNRIESTVTGLGQRGCYLKTDQPLPVGRPAIVRIKRAEKNLELHANVVYSEPGKGMGLEFTRLGPEELRTLEEWLAASRERAWLSASRRRGQRLLLRIKVRVSGHGSDGGVFEEETSTLSASPHGASVLLSTPVHKGQQINLRNPNTNAEVKCVVVHVGEREGDYFVVGLAFLVPNAKFWQVTFPPEDWTPRHPDAKEISSTEKRRDRARLSSPSLG